MDNEDLPETTWWVPPLPRLVHYGQNPAETVLWSRYEAVATEESLPTESLPTESLPIKKPACKIKITDKGKAVLLEMAEGLPAEGLPAENLPTKRPVGKGAVEAKKFPEKDTDPRIAHHEKFSKVAWTKAVKRAGSHRLRAKNIYGLTEHFTATEWLDLCARFNMLCPWCLEDKPLSLHHRKLLSRHGTNTIDNIWPLCWDCHRAVHEFGIKCEGFWLERGVISAKDYKDLGFSSKAGDVELLNPYRVYTIPRPERGEDYTFYSMEISMFSICPSCLVEDGNHLEWWAGTETYEDRRRRLLLPLD